MRAHIHWRALKNGPDTALVATLRCHTLNAFRPFTYKSGWCENLLGVLAYPHWPMIEKRIKTHRDSCILVEWASGHKWAQVGTSGYGKWVRRPSTNFFHFGCTKDIHVQVTSNESSHSGLASSRLRLQNKWKLSELFSVKGGVRSIPTCKWVWRVPTCATSCSFMSFYYFLLKLSE